MLPIGVIGAGTEWDAVWRPAFTQLSRLLVVSFYDPVAARGERVAEAHQWQPVGSLRQLLETPRLKGVVILDAGWLGTWVVHEADRRRIPALVSPRESRVEWLAAALAEATGETLVQPELRRRYTPATMRVRELTATRLGPIKELRIEIPSRTPLDVSQWAEAIDWCRFVVQSAVTSAERTNGEGDLKLVFRKQHDGAAIEANLTFCSTEDPPAFPGDFTAELTCRDGVAIISGNRRVRWKAGDEEGEEELSEDRSSAAVQLDLFARRLAGGLVPVASLDDVASAVQLARSALR